MSKISDYLVSLKDEKHIDFVAKLTPNICKEKILGINNPVLRKYASEINGSIEAEEFLSDTPHYYLEENNLHAYLIERINDFNKCIIEIDRFLPYIDNWGTCDIMSPKALKKNTVILKQKALEWIDSDLTYTKRFGIKILMLYFLEDDYSDEYPRKISKIRSDEYYVNMMIAWYFATALSKRYDDILPYLIDNSLDKWTHNKAIQKAIESYRITPEHKEELKKLKIKK